MAESKGGTRELLEKGWEDWFSLINECYEWVDVVD